MCEPWMEAEARESAWDRRLANAPRCRYCGCSIAQYDTYLELDGDYVCEHCVEQGTHSTDEWEDE